MLLKNYNILRLKSTTWLTRKVERLPWCGSGQYSHCPLSTLRYNTTSLNCKLLSQGIKGQTKKNKLPGRYLGGENSIYWGYTSYILVSLQYFQVETYLLLDIGFCDVFSCKSNSSRTLINLSHLSHFMWDLIKPLYFRFPQSWKQKLSQIIFASWF